VSVLQELVDLNIGNEGLVFSAVKEVIDTIAKRKIYVVVYGIMEKIRECVHRNPEIFKQIEKIYQEALQRREAMASRRRTL
jgi:hypothetical protein